MDFVRSEPCVCGKPGAIRTEVYGDRDILPRDVISRKLSVPNAERIFFIRHALRTGFAVTEIFNLTKIAQPDVWRLGGLALNFYAAPDGARKYFGTRGYKDFAPDGAGNRAPGGWVRRGGFFLIKFLAGAKSKL